MSSIALAGNWVFFLNQHCQVFIFPDLRSCVFQPSKSCNGLAQPMSMQALHVWRPWMQTIVTREKHTFSKMFKGNEEFRIHRISEGLQQYSKDLDSKIVLICFNPVSTLKTLFFFNFFLPGLCALPYSILA